MFNSPNTLVTAVCILAGTFWFWRWTGWRQLQWAASAASAHSSNSTNNEQHDNGCNNPNCLRCHSSSEQHMQDFRANVTILRRLVKLEPVLFEGMREEIWSEIARMDSPIRTDQQHMNDGSIIDRLKNLMQQHWKLWPSRSAEKVGNYEKSTSHVSNNSLPLSPQEGQNPTVFFLPGLEATPFHNPNHSCPQNCPCIRLWKTAPMAKNAPPIRVTGDVEVLQRNFEIIRRELLEYLSLTGTNGKQKDSSEKSIIDNELFQPFDPKVYTHASFDPRLTKNNSATSNNKDNNESNQKPEWSSIYLYHQGIRKTNICNNYFPQTTNILEAQCPHRMAGKCGLGSVYFSRLEPNTKVKEHCGPTNVRWRCHLPLVVPNSAETSVEGSCLCVGLPGVNEQRIRWKEGIPILFDDSFLHSAIHSCVGNSITSCSNAKNGDVHTNGARIVLIVDFWHPSLTEADRNALGVLYPPGS